MVRKYQIHDSDSINGDEFNEYPLTFPKEKYIKPKKQIPIVRIDNPQTFNFLQQSNTFNKPNNQILPISKGMNKTDKGE